MKKLHYVRWYSKDNEEMMGELQIRNISYDILRKIFHDVDMFGCYPISEKQKAYLEDVINSKILSKKYDYFFEVEGDYTLDINDCGWRSTDKNDI